MQVHEIREKLARLDWLEWHLRQEYEETGGEITDVTESQEEELEIVRELLADPDTTDTLGRWLKSKEELEDTYKAEAAKIASLRKKNGETIAYIKGIAGKVLRATGRADAKGTLYGFKQTVSDTMSCDNKAIEAEWLKLAQDCCAGTLPPYVTIKLSGSCTVAKSMDELPEGFERTVAETSTFIKPRKPKNQE